MRRLILGLIVSSGLLTAQDPQWIANRTSNDLHRVDLCGLASAPVSIGASLRRVRTAPDGKLWVIKFIQPTFDIRNPDGSLFLTVTSSIGNPFDVAFDVNGNAWMTAGSSVEQFDGNGNSILIHPLGVANALGITIDFAGNKWIAHRNAAPGSISRIDGITGAITNHSGPAGSTIQPTNLIADFRGIGSPSHIWVVGDSGNTVLEYDDQGNALNAFIVGTSLGSIVADTAGNVWCASFGNGSVYRLDSAGSVAQSFTISPNVLGLEFDSFGRLWTTVRNTSPTLSEVRRIDPTTGATEVSTPVGLGTQSALSSRHHFALVVDQLGDADGDGEINVIELLNGTSPYDAQSSSIVNMLTTGSSAQGGTVTVTLTTNPADSSLIAVGLGALSPGLSFPGISGQLLLDPLALLIDPSTGGPFLLSIGGSFSIPVPVANPGPVGLELHFQALTFTASGSHFSNRACLWVH